MTDVNAEAQAVADRLREHGNPYPHMVFLGERALCALTGIRSEDLAPLCPVPSRWRSVEHMWRVRGLAALANMLRCTRAQRAMREAGLRWRITGAAGAGFWMEQS